MIETLPNSIIHDATSHWGIRLQCPRCRTDTPYLTCPVCTFEMCVNRGIVCALPPERATHYAQFMEDYERIRVAEGRSSESESFYLGLPYKDATGNNGKQWQIRARSYDYLNQFLLKQKPSLENGRILDLGAGNGWMSFRLALAGYKPIAVDLLINDRDGLGAATHYQNSLRELFPRFQAEAVCLPFQDDQFDAVIFNASFHYSENYEATLREALRCIRKDGIIVISDTPWYSSEDSGMQMVSERHAAFRRTYGTASDSIRSLEFLTDERLRSLEEKLSIQWTVHSPHYGFKWAMRPFLAKLRNRREPSQFRIYVVQKNV